MSRICILLSKSSIDFFGQNDILSTCTFLRSYRSKISSCKGDTQTDRQTRQTKTQTDRHTHSEGCTQRCLTHQPGFAMAARIAWGFFRDHLAISLSIDALFASLMAHKQPFFLATLSPGSTLTNHLFRERLCRTEFWKEEKLKWDEELIETAKNRSIKSLRRTVTFQPSGAVLK